MRYDFCLLQLELRAQLGQAEVTKQHLVCQNQKLEAEKQELEQVNEELRNDVEVAENDRTVLKDHLVEVEPFLPFFCDQMFFTHFFL